MKKKQLQAGFSLVEAVFVTVLMVVVFATFGTFLLRLQNGVASYKERSQLNDEVGLTTQIVIDDVEKVGTNLSLSSKESFTGTVYVPFLSYNGYQVSGNRITQIGSLVNALVSAVWWNGKGELKWRGNNYIVTVQDGARIIQVSLSASLLTIIENGSTVFERTVMPGAQISVITSTVVVNGEAVCRTSYKVENETAFESTGGCFTNSVEILASLSIEGYLDEMSLNAAEIILRSTSVFPVRLPLLPISNGVRMEIPLVATSNGFFFLAGDEKCDEMYLQADSLFVNNTAQTIQLADSSALAVNDALLLADYLNNRSILLKVTAISPSLTVVPVTQANSFSNGFDKFYSPTADFEGYNFLRGTRLTKLAVPIEYLVQTENDISSLYRRSRGSAWELVVSNIQNFAVNQNISSTRVGFVISFDVLSEGVENERVAQPVRIEVSPRSLNRTFEAR